MTKNLLAASLVAICSSFTASAGLIIIDDFSVDQGPLTASGTLGPLAIGNGIERTLTLTTLASSGPVNYTAEVNSGVLDITNGTGENSTVHVAYALPALGVPVGATNLQLTVVVVDSDGNPTQLDLGGIASGTFQIPANSAGALLPFSIALPPDGPGTLTITLNGANGWDLSLDSIGLSWTDPTGDVPEPVSCVLVGSGLAALGLIRRRRA